MLLLAVCFRGEAAFAPSGVFEKVAAGLAVPGLVLRIVGAGATGIAS
jgi:hypothetical protein